MSQNTEQKLDLVIQMLKIHDKQFEQIERRFEQIDKRFEQLERRFEQVDKRFEQIDKQFEQIKRRFNQIDNRFDQMFDLVRDEKHEREKMKEKLDKVYETRHEVEYKITRDFVLKNLAWNTAVIFFGVTFAYLALT